ncbi:hypothetical protein HZZ13_23080 [Bradyrhizobium sp. CNPSo 4010]|uniref:Uncharacterized protein n=1 Tax=Bradyrhizobium agreste TaxID=2751811 RepID=A0ABS0PTY7_9BRAD|nr:hypothetical protein [Bradyrhizobium agreste]MBH5400656.1 hypothetical protein [Bradyrhizobium agreste]
MDGRVAAFNHGTFMMHSRKETSRFTTAKRCSQLSLAKDSELAAALRLHEATFSADVLPCDVEPVAPKDFYAAMASGLSRTPATPRGEGPRQFPYLAA